MAHIIRHTRTEVRFHDAVEWLHLDVARHLWGASRATSTDPEGLFKLSLAATQTDIVDLEGETSPRKIGYRILEDDYSVALTPISFVNNFNVPLRSLKINLPDCIRADCLTLSQYTTQDDEDCIILDMITDTNLLVTIVVRLSDFIANQKPIASSENYKEWCTFSQPYGFDVRRPHIMHSYKFDYLVVFLKDGGLIALQRNSNFELEPIIFNDNSYLESLGQLWKPWTKKNNYITDKELSEKTVIDVIHFQDYLLTVTMNKRLRIWSITSQSLVLEKNLAEFAPHAQDNKPFFESNPTKLLDICTIEMFGSLTSYLTVFLPFGNGIFKIFSINTESFDICDLGQKYTFDTSIPQSNSIWLVGDFQLTNHHDNLQLWVLWKSNTSSFIQNLEIGEDYEPQWYGVQDSDVIVDKKLLETPSEYYIRKLFRNGLYSNQILETALSIFEGHFLSGLQPDPHLDNLSLCERVVRSISRGVEMTQKYEVSIDTQWSRFYTLCQEFKKQADEPLKLHIDTSSEYILVVNRQDFAFVRPISETELLYYNKSLKIQSIGSFTEIDNHLRFLNIISDFKTSLSNDVLSAVQNEVLRIFSHPSHATDKVLSSIYDEHLKTNINPVNLEKLVRELMHFDNNLTLVQDIVNLQLTKGDKVPSLSNSRLTSFGLEIVAEITKDTIQVQKDVLFSLLILLLVLDFEDKKLLAMLSKQIIQLMSTFELYQETSEVGFNANDSFEVDQPLTSSNTLFVEAMNLKYDSHFPVSQFHVAPFITKDVLPFLMSQEFLYTATSILISRGLSNFAYNRLLKFFDATPIFKFLKALVFFKTQQPVKASKYFVNHADEISKRQLTPTEKASLKPIAPEFMKLFNPNAGKYYLDVATLFLNNSNFDQAHFFMTVLAEKRSGTGFDKKYLEHESYLLFMIAIQKLDFVVANDALPHIKTPELREQALKKFLYDMCIHQQINKLNDFSSLKEDPKLDGLILNRAQSSTDLSKSLWFYQVLYSHRLGCGNYRGAADALYQFIESNKTTVSDAIKLRIAELYGVVLNLVCTLEEDDQWVIKHGAEQDVVSLEQLKEERNAIVRSFSRELRTHYES